MIKFLNVAIILLLCLMCVVGCFPRDDSLDNYYKALPTAKKLISVDISNNNLPDSVVDVYKDEYGAGYSIMVRFNGYHSDASNIIVGVSADNVVMGIVCVRYTDPIPLGESFENCFVGKDLSGVESVDLVAEVTISSKAYRNAVADAVKSAEILSK